MTTNERQPLIQVQHLGKAFGDLGVLKDINVDIYKGDVVCVIGPSGSGKSTFLRCLNRLEEPTSGKILFEGVDITDPKTDIDKHRQKMGMVFQQFNLFPHMTIMKNLTIAPMKLQGVSQKDAEAEAMRLLERVGLADRANAYPNQLSGGQRQRAWIAMTLAQETEMILLDEPTTYLDMAYQLDVPQLLERMNREKQLTIVMVLHDLNEACRFADHIIGLKNGKVVCEGRPADVITRENIREIYGIDAKLVMSDGGYPICMEFDRVIKTL